MNFENVNPPIQGTGSPYRKYVALVSQAGTDAPVANVLENGLGKTPVWSYDSPGLYFLTLSGGFPAGRTVIMTSLNHVDGGLGNMQAQLIESGLISVSVVNEFVVYANGGDFVIEIRVYQ